MIYVWSLWHAFLTACNNNIWVIRKNRMITRSYRSQTWTTNLINNIWRNFFWPGIDLALARRPGAHWPGPGPWPQAFFLNWAWPLFQSILSPDSTFASEIALKTWVQIFVNENFDFWDILFLWRCIFLINVFWVASIIDFTKNSKMYFAYKCILGGTTGQPYQKYHHLNERT